MARTKDLVQDDLMQMMHWKAILFVGLLALVLMACEPSELETITQ